MTTAAFEPSPLQQEWIQRATHLHLGGLARGELALDMLVDPSEGWPQTMASMLEEIWPFPGEDLTLDYILDTWDSLVLRAWMDAGVNAQQLVKAMPSLHGPMRQMAPSVLRHRVRLRRALVALDTQAYKLFGVGMGQLADRERVEYREPRVQAAAARRARLRDLRVVSG